MKFDYNIALSYAIENEDIVKLVYRYLKAEGVSVFFAPAPECQLDLTGKNQREIFYEIFGLRAEYVALFVSKDYILKPVPMEEAGIAIAKHSGNGSVIPIYMDNARLPKELFDPTERNYYVSCNSAEIANHLALKIMGSTKDKKKTNSILETKSNMNINNNRAKKQIFIQNFEGEINL